MSIIELNKYRKKNQNYSIIEKDSYYDCLVGKEKNKHKAAPLTAIKVGDIYALVYKNKDKSYKIEALHFFKDTFTLPEVIDWFEHFNIVILPDNQEIYLIENCLDIKEVAIIENTLLILYQKGDKSLEIQKKDLLKYMDSPKEEYKKPMNITLVLNDEVIDYIPRIKINKKEDILIVNGNCIVADYIDEYNGNVGFYLNSNPTLPISFIFTEETHVYIDIILKEQGKIIIIEYEYEIQFL